MSVSEFLAQLYTCVVSLEPPDLSASLADLFSLDLNNPSISSLQNDILDHNVNIDEAVEAGDAFNGEWPGFLEMTKSYLRFAAYVNPDDMVESYDLYGQFFNDLQSAFSNSRGRILEATIAQTCRVVVNLSLQLDGDSDHDSSDMIRTSFVSTVLLKIFNSIRAEKPDSSADVPEFVKKRVILLVAVVLCRVYFKLGQPNSCANVFSNIHTANLTMSSFHKAQRVEYRYLLGRFYLGKNQLLKAYTHLSWAFNNCLSSSHRNRIAILRYLIPASMLLGKLPTIQLMEYYQLTPQYGPLVHSIKKGDYGQYMKHLEGTFKPWFLKRNLLILMKSRAIILLFRGAILNAWKSFNRPTTLGFKDLSIAINFATNTGPEQDQLRIDLASDMDYEQIENICISLISQGFIKANIFTRNQVIRLKPVDAIIPVAELNQLDSISLDSQEKWMDL